jgi:aspartyl-tRNA(Asn)/glutamyl-tRNA(Gln) amidotransferase subunit C
MSKITPEEVRRIAALANIGLQDDEVDHFAGELGNIVEFVEQLQAVDVSNVAPTDQVTGLVDVWRSDEVRPGLSHDDLKLNAPAWRDGHYEVKRVLGDE